MKKNLTLLALTALAIAVVSCKEKDKNVSVEGVTLDKTTATLTVGDTLTLTATVLPEKATNKAVSWLSSNTDVATIANGTITAKDFGLTNIIVTTIDGNKKDTCVVTVGLGTVSFATDSTWTISGNGISQIWSDAVQTTVCRNKTTFNGNNIDCRSNPEQKGDLFSWHAVNEYKNELCPAPWRIPTMQDFIDLDIALGGTGRTRNDLEFINSNYLNSAVFGGTLAGYCNTVGNLLHQGSFAGYWCSDANINDRGGDGLVIRVDGINDRISFNIFGVPPLGLSLRCVRDN